MCIPGTAFTGPVLTNSGAPRYTTGSMLQPVRKRRGITLCMLLAGVASAALPEPPKQHEPWTPPSGQGIPDYVVKVSTALFDAGRHECLPQILQRLHCSGFHIEQ